MEPICKVKRLFYRNVQDVEGETILNWLIMMKETKFATNILNEFEEIDVNIKSMYYSERI